MKKYLAILALAFALASAPAHASLNLSGVGGLHFGSGDGHTGFKNVGFNYGGELTYSLTAVEVGAFFQRYNLPVDVSGAGSENQNFYGAVGRVSLMDWFVDARLGFTKMTTFAGNGPDTDSAFGFGVGAGYAFSLGPVFSIRPRVGYNYVPLKLAGSTLGHSLIDVAALFTVSL
jgi:hypothetical protein